MTITTLYIKKEAPIGNWRLFFFKMQDIIALYKYHQYTYLGLPHQKQNLIQTS
ncbi:MAG: hypothetical protein JWR54_1562 [Mucilaginibacter sp.]|nr:hypothetical protein [Mucilaginibacter sp.]